MRLQRKSVLSSSRAFGAPTEKPETRNEYPRKGAFAG
jgi:hypothetical protein